MKPFVFPAPPSTGPSHVGHYCPPRERAGPFTHVGKNNCLGLECGRDGGVHFWPPLFGTLALRPDRAGVLIGVRLTGAQTKHRDSTGHGQELSAATQILGLKRQIPFEIESETAILRRDLKSHSAQNIRDSSLYPSLRWLLTLPGCKHHQWWGAHYLLGQQKGYRLWMHRCLV